MRRFLDSLATWLVLAVSIAVMGLLIGFPFLVVRHIEQRKDRFFELCADSGCTPEQCEYEWLKATAGK